MCGFFSARCAVRPLPVLTPLPHSRHPPGDFTSDLYIWRLEPLKAASPPLAIIPMHGQFAPRKVCNIDFQTYISVNTGSEVRTDARDP